MTQLTVSIQPWYFARVNTAQARHLDVRRVISPIQAFSSAAPLVPNMK